MPKELLSDQDLICLMGALIVARAKEHLLDLISYIKDYSAQDLASIWEYISHSLSNQEKEWFRSLLEETVTNA